MLCVRFTEIYTYYKLHKSLGSLAHYISMFNAICTIKWAYRIFYSATTLSKPFSFLPSHFLQHFMTFVAIANFSLKTKAKVILKQYSILINRSELKLSEALMQWCGNWWYLTDKKHHCIKHRLCRHGRDSSHILKTFLLPIR